MSDFGLQTFFQSPAPERPVASPRFQIESKQFAMQPPMLVRFDGLVFAANEPLALQPGIEVFGERIEEEILLHLPFIAIDDEFLFQVLFAGRFGGNLNDDLRATASSQIL